LVTVQRIALSGRDVGGLLATTTLEARIKRFDFSTTPPHQSTGAEVPNVARSRYAIAVKHMIHANIRFYRSSALFERCCNTLSNHPGFVGASGLSRSIVPTCVANRLFRRESRYSHLIDSSIANLRIFADRR